MNARRILISVKLTQFVTAPLEAILVLALMDLPVVHVMVNIQSKILFEYNAILYDTKILFHLVKTQYRHFRFHANYFYLERFLNKLADDQCSSITKGSIYHINIQLFTTAVDCPQNMMFK